MNKVEILQYMRIFLICAINLPLPHLEKISNKILDEKWYDFREHYWFTEKYVEIIDELYVYW